jgi:hypothetical protein
VVSLGAAGNNPHHPIYDIGLRGEGQ